jgi:glycosyltransferase involved in cell wall biosynthesis
MISNNETGFVVFSDDWGGHPSSCQHIFKRIAMQYQTVWVNTVGMRLPTVSVYDIKKIFEKIARWCMPKRRIKGLKLIVYNPVMFPFSNLLPIRKLNKILLENGLKRMFKKMEIRRLFVVTTVPNAADILDYFKEAKVVYYCVDDFTQWPGLLHSLILDMEQELLKRTDILIAVSEKLLEFKSPFCKKSYLLTHGVDTEHFRQDKTAPQISALSKPVIGFYGLIDERMDLDLLLYLSEERPSWTIVIVGKKAVDLSKLEVRKNIIFTGEVSYMALPSYVNGFNICMLPYKVSGCTISIAPLKLKEYLASGKPVVSVCIPGVSEYKDCIYISKNYEDFVRGIEEYLKNDSQDKVLRRKKLIAEESWENKAEKMLKYIGVK